MSMTKITVQNLKCGGCANTIKKNLEKIRGVSNISVEVENGVVTFDSGLELKVETVEKSLRSLGYPPINDENTFSAKAKSYVSCGMGRIMNN